MGKRVTKEIFSEKVAAKYGDRFNIIDFTGPKSKMTYFDTWYNTTSTINSAKDIFKRKVKEKYNFGEARPLKYTDAEIAAIFKEKAGDEYIIQSPYIGYHKYITVKHTICGKSYEVRPSDFIVKNRRCPYCSGRRKAPDEIKQKVSDITNGEYTLLSEYTRSIDEVLVLHNKCGHTFKTSENRFINNGNRCPYCSPIKCGKSYKEKDFSNFIENTLSNKNFEENYRVYISGKHYNGIDLFYKDINIGFEFDGLYWHSAEKHKEPFNLYKKTRYLREKNNIQIIHIFEDEWDNRQDDVKSFIKNEFINSDIVPTLYKELSLSYGRKILKHSLYYSKISNRDKIYGFYHNKTLLFVISIIDGAVTNIHKIAPCRINFLDLFDNIPNVSARLDMRFFNPNNNFLIDNGFSIQYLSQPRKFFIPHARNKRYTSEKECKNYEYTIYDCGYAEYIKKKDK